jgi:hypothetical protein
VLSIEEDQASVIGTRGLLLGDPAYVRRSVTPELIYELGWVGEADGK